MSVVLDAVNSFFGPNHSHFRDTTPHTHDPNPQPPRGSRTPSRSEVHMSEPAPRAPSSSASSHQPSSDRPLPNNVRASSSQAPPSRSAQPPSPTLTAERAPQSSELFEPPGPNPIDQDIPAMEEAAPRPRKIKVRDLEHIQSFANEHMGSFSEIRSRSRSRSRGAEDSGTQYEISEMKVEHIIEMVAGLLTKITTTNDRQHEHLHRQPPSIDAASHLNAQTTSVLAFHGKNVPNITILNYLSRINKYCPTSYEVFLSLLVYFDRMTERVNAGPMQSLREANEHATERKEGQSDLSESTSTDRMEGVIATTPSGTQQVTPPSSGSLERAEQQAVPGTPHSRPTLPDSPSIPSDPSAVDPYNLSHFFVVDSFNIHRLVIAGVTCASKFFSDVFYTNSRYAKVGGLPLPELNHLELQFLLLNDFRLSVPVEEIEAYGTMLVEFYAREVVAQQKATEPTLVRSPSRSDVSESSNESVETVRAGG